MIIINNNNITYIFHTFFFNFLLETNWNKIRLS